MTIELYSSEWNLMVELLKDEETRLIQESYRLERETECPQCRKAPNGFQERAARLAAIRARLEKPSS